MNECFDCGFWDSEWEACTCPSTDTWYACSIENKKPENIKFWEDHINGTKLNDTDIKFDIPEENAVTKLQNGSLAKAIADINKKG